MIIKVGVMDNVGALEGARPGAELFIEHRVAWVREMEGVEQVREMGS